MSAKPSFKVERTEAGTRYIETACPGRGCVKPYRIDENHPDFERVLRSLRRGKRDGIFCYHRPLV